MKPMKRALPLIFGVALAAAAMAQGWLLKSPYETKGKTTWKMVVDANVDGGTHVAKMDYVLNVQSNDPKAIKVVASWNHLTVDDNEMSEESSWEVELAPSGAITKATDGEEYARMLLPMLFTYPGKEVEAGAKWSESIKTSKDAKDIKVDYEVLAKEKVGDKDALKVAAKFKEDKTDGMTGDDIFWVDKDGKVLKFELKLKNWMVPMAGGGPVEATIKADLAK